MHKEFKWGNLREGDHLEDPDVDEDNIKMDLREVEWGRDWIGLAQDRDRWRAVVYTVMKFLLP